MMVGELIVFRKKEIMNLSCRSKKGLAGLGFELRAPAIVVSVLVHFSTQFSGAWTCHLVPLREAPRGPATRIVQIHNSFLQKDADCDLDQKDIHASE